MSLEGCKLEQGIINDCVNPITQGLNPNAIIINYDDIDRASSTVSGSIITDLVLKMGKTGYAIEAPQRGLDHSDIMRKGEFQSDFDHNLMVKVMDNSPLVKAGISKLAKGLFVIVISNKHIKENASGSDVKGDTKYEALGWYVGLELMEATRDTADTEVKGGWALTFGLPDKAKEPTPALTVFKTDLATTETLIESLLP